MPPGQTDPMFRSPADAALASSTALMYVNLIITGVFLLEALVLYALLRRRLSRWLVLESFALAALALALALYMWALYAHGSKAPHFPPAWLESFGGVPEPARLLMIALIFLTVLAPAHLVAAVFSYNKGPS